MESIRCYLKMLCRSGPRAIRLIVISYGHSTTSIGGGYVWPDIVFASDGDRVMVQATPAFLPGHGIRYLSGFAHKKKTGSPAGV